MNEYLSILENHLLKKIGGPEGATYGECCGLALDSLRQRGLVVWGSPTRDSIFVSLTCDGFKRWNAIKETEKDAS